jgi:hypothetical protein
VNGDGAHVASFEAPMPLEVDLRDLDLSHITPPPFACERIIPMGVGTLLGGHGGVGKTCIILIIAAHAACGKLWAGLHSEQCQVVFVSFEDDGEKLRHRLRGIVAAYDLDIMQIEANLRIYDGSEVDAALVCEVSEFGIKRLMPTAMMEWLREVSTGADLIIIDNASDVFDGDENSRRQVRQFFRLLTQLARRNNAAVVLLAHIDKHSAKNGSQKNSYSGSTAWHNSARSRLALLSTDAGVELVHEKSNLWKLAEPIHLEWREAAGAGVLVPSASQCIAAPADDAEAVLTVLRAAAASAIIVTTATAGPRTVMHTLCDLPELPNHLRYKDGKRRISAALMQLEREGRIVRRPWKDASRNAREKWELTQGLTQSAAPASLKTRVSESPIPPVLTHSRTGVRVSTTEDRKAGTHATHAAGDYMLARDGDR